HCLRINIGALRSTPLEQAYRKLAGVVARLAPQAVASGCATGCDSGGCNSCDSNTSTNAAPASREKPIRIVRKPQGKG
ncbi:hypothetical protein QCF19_14235, partial [Staphylococcus aureus]|nr:hypothetical protein [Staphylococcus aureus]